MKIRRRIAGTLIAAPFVVSGLPAAAAPANALPAAHMKGEISYVTGGVGQDQAAAMMHAAKNYPLELEFVKRAKPRDEYLADIKVQIMDQHDRTMLDTTADGPFLLAKLPAGKYTISAADGNKIEKRTVEVAGKEHRRVVFVWS
jgi:hypothetical protein